MTTTLKVDHHDLNDKDEKYKVTLTGISGDIINGALVECELKLSARIDNIAEKFTRGARFIIKIEPEPE